MSPSVLRATRILVVGKDARSDAIVTACLESPERPDVYGYCEFAHPGFLAKCKDVARGSLRDVTRIVSYAMKVRPDLAIVGPEEPLEEGLVDALESAGIPTFGPTRDLARLETSKSWTRTLVEKHGIPGNPQYRIFSSTQDLKGFLLDLGEFVIKPDGLTGGKGVRVFGEHIHSLDEAITYASELLAASPRLLVEERLEGEEFSLQSICDGEYLVHCPVVQDHKRALNGDVGPNTGGMGSYSCADHSLPFLTDRDVQEAKAINAAVAEAVNRETGRPFRGVLYGGFMVTRSGVKLLEYNARFGDPEALNVLPLFEGDFVQLVRAVTNGTLSSVTANFKPLATVCKYVVPTGYPEEPTRDQAIVIPPETFAREDLKVFFAAVDKRDGEICLTGSRAVAFVGVGTTIEQAEKLAEAGAASVRGPVTHRSDIGTQDLLRLRVDHLSRIRSATPVAR
jgi:phosphoribosylamine---glycine ligase